jgi:hypothetical protein
MPVAHPTATTCVGVVGWGVCRLSISNGWPGPQPATRHRVIATTISIVIVFIISLSKKSSALSQLNTGRALEIACFNCHRDKKSQILMTTESGFGGG